MKTFKSRWSALSPTRWVGGRGKKRLGVKPLHLLVGLSFASGPVSAAPLEITLPPETDRLIESPLPGYTLANTFCYTCHSVDYLRTQPVSSRTYWTAAVTKMQKTFGAPIPEEAVAPIADYLVKTYGNERGTAAQPAAPASRGDLTPASAAPKSGAATGK